MYIFRVSDTSTGILLHSASSSAITCSHVIALEEAEFSNVKLYPGDWSDWISYEGKSVATGYRGRVVRSRSLQCLKTNTPPCRLMPGAVHFQ